MSAKSKRRLLNGIRLALVYAILAAAAVTILYPYAWMVVASLRPTHKDMWDTGLISGVIPNDVSLEAYQFLMDRVGAGEFSMWVKNSLIFSVGGTLLNVLVCLLAAYALSNRDLPGGRILLVFFLVTMVIPQQLVGIQLYLVVNDLGLTNTYTGIVLPLAAEAFSILIMYRFFMEMPSEILDAARIDGANELGVLRRVVMPLARPVIGTVLLQQFVASWNAFTVPLILGQQNQFRNLQVAMAYFNNELNMNFRAIMALGSLITIPVLILFVMTQKTLIRGITAGAIKGAG